MITGKSLFSGDIPSSEQCDIVTRFENYFALDIPSSEQCDIVTRFENYFALFDGRKNVEPMHYAKVRQTVTDLFDESAIDGQLETAEELLAKETTIKVNQIERCITGRVFYHLKVTTRRNASVRHHITGFATLNEANERVKEVETKVKMIRVGGKRRFGLNRSSSRIGMVR